MQFLFQNIQIFQRKEFSYVPETHQCTFFKKILFHLVHVVNRYKNHMYNIEQQYQNNLLTILITSIFKSHLINFKLEQSSIK